MGEYIINFLIVWHISAVIISIYIHRSVAHGQIKFHPVIEHVFRFWMWAVFAFNWKGWNKHWAVHHRKHHRYSDQKEDPHSPVHQTFAELNNTNPELHGVTEQDYELYGQGVEAYNDRAERIYNNNQFLGMAIHVLLQTVLFGIPGACVAITYCLFTKTFITFTGKWIIHKIGFRYAQQSKTDNSRIVFPIALMLGGEELHTNHHNNPIRLNFAHRWFEFDVGYWYCKLLSTVGLATIQGRQ